MTLTQSRKAAKDRKEERPPLSLGDMPADEFRQYGHELIDWIADYFEHIEDLPVLAQIEPGDLKAQLPSTAPEHGESMGAILADVDKLIVPALTHWSHPSFFAYFATRSEEHTSELQSRSDLVCRLLLEKKKNKTQYLSVLHIN